MPEAVFTNAKSRIINPDDSFILISCQSGSYDLDKEICSLTGLHLFLSLDRASFYFNK
jgi:hypothetical protein